MPARRGIALLPDIPDRQSRDGRPQRVIGSEDAVIPVPVPPRLWDEIGEPIEELKRRELDDAAGPRLRGLSLSAWPDPVGGLVPRHHVTPVAGKSYATVLCQGNGILNVGEQTLIYHGR